VKERTSERTEPTLTRKAGRRKTPRRDDARNRVPARLTANPHPQVDGSQQEESTLENSELVRIKDLPKEVGVMLITAGILGVILPGPGTPAIIAGGLALWPNAFGKLESWLQRRYPGIHRQSMQQISRFLRDLDKRYPYTSQK
jgi:hypothetical protein